MPVLKPTLNFFWKLMNHLNNFTQYSKWFPLLAICITIGCAKLPQEKGIWPWEYGRGQGEPNTGDYVAFRAGVANFGDAPKAVKPVTPDPVEPQTTETKTASKTPSSPKIDPPPEIKQVTENTTTNTKKPEKDYDFKVRESKTTSASLLLSESISPEHDLTAINNGYAPVSVAVNVDQESLLNTSADKFLPLYAVVPAKSDRSLVHFSAKRKDQAFNVRYNYIWRIGDYTATHNCQEQYRFPFGEKVRAFASVNNDSGSTPYTRYAVVFSMPKGTPVLAARKGTVIRITSNDKVDVLHEDSTIGTYSHLEKIDEKIVVGKPVTAEEVIGIAGTAEDNNDAYMQLTVWRPEPAPIDPLPTRAQRIGLDAQSFPIAFSSNGIDKGKVLTQNQAISRGVLPVSKARAKRK
jgi:murein DD-endopeptidase MepM/ murein hydrolase activator NlpD